MSILKVDKNGNNLFFNSLIKAAVEKDNTAREKCRVALQAFMNEPRTKQKTVVKKLAKNIQAMTVSTDLPFLTGESFSHVHAENNFDLGYERAYDNVPRIQGKRSWSWLGTTDGLTVKKVPEGGRIDVVGVHGDKMYFECDKYGGAIGWTYEAIEGREIMQLINLGKIFRNGEWETKANIGYTLLQAAAAKNTVIPYATSGTGQLQNDIITINSAIATLTKRLKDKGYGNMANARVIIYAHRDLEDRIGAAMRATTSALAAAGSVGVQITSRPIDIVYTYNSAITWDRPIVLVPGWGLQKMDYMLPTVFTDKQDILTLNIAQAVWADYGFGVGDTDQCQNFNMG
jgi:hypothetical protein